MLDIPEDDYDRLTVENSILRRFFRQDKMAVVDLKLSTKSGRIIHVELQVEKQASLRNRIVYYIARLIGDQLKWGEPYRKLHQVVSIVICNHTLLEDESYYISQYELRNRENRRFTDLLKLVILELPKLPEAEDGPIWRWLKFLQSKEKEEFEMLARQYPELEKPIFCVRKMSLFEKWREIQFHKNLWKEDDRMRKLYIETEARAKGMAEGKAAGMAEGMAEGMAKGQSEKALEIARKMKISGRPVDEIAEFTGLSIEIIEKG